MAKAKSSVPAGHHTVTPHLIMNDASSALDWYAKALGAEILARAPGPDGKIMHAEIRVGNSVIMLNDEMGGGKSAKALGGSPVSLWLYVDDCDALFKRAVAAGATVPPRPDGRTGGPVLGRSLRGDRRSGGLQLDDCDPQGRPDAGRARPARAGVLQELRGFTEVARSGPAGLAPAGPPYRASSA